MPCIMYELSDCCQNWFAFSVLSHLHNIENLSALNNNLKKVILAYVCVILILSKPFKIFLV